MSTISNGKVVQISYVLKNSKGEVLDQSNPADPFAYLHGRHQIVPGLEQAIEGLAKGAKKEVEVSPKDGYGEYDERMKVEVERKQFPQGVPLKEGMQFESSQGGQPIVFTIEAIDGEKVTINGNHPLAGETLFFSIEVIDMRDATAEELAHGHAHGPGGHHHH